MRTILSSILITILLIIQSCGVQDSSVSYTITIDNDLIDTPLDGRLMLLISSNDGAEPRFQVSDNPGTQLVYGMDVDGMAPGEPLVFDNESFGYPTGILFPRPAL